ncbi:MAG: 50S ribosomal protein L10 [Candidatus Brockarchaeota archaeon]|nr:50S ribosomal protein L10 [Candidatus Brockarchaeota archaeon]
MSKQLLLKKRIVDEILNLLESYRTVMLVNTYKVKASTINEARKRLRGRAVFKHVKTTLLQKAAEKTGSQKMMGFLKKYGSSGSIMLILSNEEPYELQQELRKYSIKLPLSAGDIVDREIVVPAGNTGLPAGPVISSLNEVGLPTRIETGSIWITRDTVVAKPGDVITPQLAAVLSKLNIRPVEAYVKTYAALCDGIVYTEESLSITVEDIKNSAAKSLENALKIALTILFPTPESIGMMLREAFSKAISLGIRSEYYDENTVKIMLQTARALAEQLEKSLEKA